MLLILTNVIPVILQYDLYYNSPAPILNATRRTKLDRGTVGRMRAKGG